MSEDKEIAQALLSAADYLKGEDKKRQVTIRRGGKDLFSFTLEPLSESDFERARNQNIKNKGRRNEHLDGSRFVAQLIYEATVEEDKARLWRNREVQEKLNAASGIDVVQQVLTPAERSELESTLLDMIGYAEDLTQMIKNL